jgi:hypothetical protein
MLHPTLLHQHGLSLLRFDYHLISFVSYTGLLAIGSVVLKAYQIPDPGLMYS